MRVTRLCTGAIAALTLMGSAAAQAQGVYVETPATVYVACGRRAARVRSRRADCA